MITEGMTIRLCGFDILVFLRSEEYLGGDEGRWLLDRHWIYIKEELSPLRQWEALHHELLHAIEDIKGWDLKESCVRDISLTQFQMFRDNSILVEAFQNANKQN